jgi:protein-disulfide isomerase
MKAKLETITSLVVAAVAVAMAGSYFFGATPGRKGTEAPGPPEFVRDWNDLWTIGLVDGKPDAPVKIVEFADLECPFCAKFRAVLDTVQEKYRDKVSLAFVHWPIPGHRFAVPAARAAECANEQGRFGQFSAVVYRNQDSLGLKTWTAYARDAGVTDTKLFERCTVSTSPLTRVDAGRAAGKRLGVSGTPTVIINGWKYPSPPGSAEISRAVDSVLAGRSPFKRGA